MTISIVEALFFIFLEVMSNAILHVSQGIFTRNTKALALSI